MFLSASSQAPRLALQLRSFTGQVSLAYAILDKISSGKVGFDRDNFRQDIKDACTAGKYRKIGQPYDAKGKRHLSPW